MKLIKSSKPKPEFDINKIKGDPYAILGVPENATPRMIKQSYRVLAAMYHQDVFHGDPDIFILIGQAKDCLMDPEKRAMYDEFYIFGNITGQSTSRAAVGQVQTMFSHIVKEAPQLDFTDMKGSMKAGTEQSINEYDNKIDEAKQKIKKFEKTKTRISGTAREGKKLVCLLQISLDISVEQERQQIAKLKSQQMILDEVLVLLDEFECTFEETVNGIMGGFGSATSSGGW